MERFLGQGRFELGPRAVRGVKGQTSSEGLPGKPGGTKVCVCVWGYVLEVSRHPPVTSGLGKARSMRQEK